MYSLTVSDHIMVAHSFGGGYSARPSGCTAPPTRSRRSSARRSWMNCGCWSISAWPRGIAQGARRAGLPQSGRGAGLRRAEHDAEFLAAKSMGCWPGAAGGQLGAERQRHLVEGRCCARARCLGRLSRGISFESSRSSSPARSTRSPAATSTTAGSPTACAAAATGPGRGTRRPHPLADATAERRPAPPRRAARRRAAGDRRARPARLRAAGRGAGRRGAVGLIHHPTALEHGALPRTRRAARDRARPLPPPRPRSSDQLADTAERLTADFDVARRAHRHRRARHRPRAARPGSGGPGAASSRSARWCRARAMTCCCGRWPACPTSTGR